MMYSAYEVGVMRKADGYMWRKFIVNADSTTTAMAAVEQFLLEEDEIWKHKSALYRLFASPLEIDQDMVAEI